MHFVVQRYIGPLTKELGVGLALALNAGSLARVSVGTAEAVCFATVFISHSWGELFDDFAKTLHRSLDPTTVVWVCSFAIYQHGDIAGSLGSIESCPFVLAMKSSHRVLVVTDESAEALHRCWVVLEAALANQLGLPYDITLPDDGNQSAWNLVAGRLAVLDVSDCQASVETDKAAILAYARAQTDGILGLNQKVRQIASAAKHRAELMAAILSGDLRCVQQISDDGLLSWRDIHGRNATHLAAMKSLVALIVHIAYRTDKAHLDIQDCDGRTPISISAEEGSVSAVSALISLGANWQISGGTDGRSPLHYACQKGHVHVAETLLHAKAQVESRSATGKTPLYIAAFWNNSIDLIRILIEHRAHCETTSTDLNFTPLIIAAQQGHEKSAATLLASRADANSTCGQNRQSALFKAVSNGHYGMVQLLLGAGADSEFKDTNGFSCDGVLHYVKDEATAKAIQTALERHRSRRKYCCQVQ